MNILIIGSGGREHALAVCVNKSSHVRQVFCLPGNAGTAQVAQNVAIDVSNLEEILKFAKSNSIDLAVIGPEAPLVAGLADLLVANGIEVFGPNKQAAQLEGSKSFAKDLMNKYNVPTGAALSFNSIDPALNYVNACSFPLVLKADGLAAGKGVVICWTREEANNVLNDFFVKNIFGPAGQTVLIEEFLSGPEVSLLCFVDGQTFIPMVTAQDFKAALDGDKGPNTGGMGAYSPVILADNSYNEIINTVVEPTIYGLAKEGIDYQGVLYFGLMLTENGPKVLEFNVRFGDPETQAILPRLESDLVEVMLAVANRELSSINLKWKEDKCVSIVAASGGYPGDYKSGLEIGGLGEASSFDDVSVFHAGTKLDGSRVLTAGGRVLNVSALAQNYKEAREKAYQVLSKINFEGIYYRKDIALKISEKEKVCQK